MFLFHFYVESTKLMQKLVIKMIQLKSCQIFEITFGRGGGGVCSIWGKMRLPHILPEVL